MIKVLNNPKNDNLAPILLLEDDEIDARYIDRVLSTLDIGNPLIVANDGIEALHRLTGSNGRIKIGLPALIILDLNMPKMGGWDFLTKVKNSPVLKDTPVVIFTTSGAEYDKEINQGIHKDAYFIKGDDNHLFKSFIKDFFGV